MQIHSGPHSTSSFKKGIFIRVLISILIFGCIGILSSRLAMINHENWYSTLNQPFFAPPRWLPWMLWSIVYILMGGAFGIIWQIKAINRYPIITKFARRGMVIFIIHFLFVFIYPTLLFGLHHPVFALVDLIIILIFIVILIRHFYRLDRLSSFLLIPYFIWCLYAAALNISIIVLN